MGDVSAGRGLHGSLARSHGDRAEGFALPCECEDQLKSGRFVRIFDYFVIKTAFSLFALLKRR